MSGLVSAALLLLSVVAGVGGFVGAGASAAAAKVSTVASTSATSTRVAADRRSTPVLSTPGSRKQVFGAAPHHPESADVAVTGWLPPFGLGTVSIPSEAAELVLALQVTHRGRAPPPGSLLV
jgi:hypothetical protein